MLTTVISAEAYSALKPEIQAEYALKGDKYELQLEGGFTSGDRDRLQEALRKEREQREATEKLLKKYGSLQPDQAAALTDEVTALRLKLEMAGARPEEIEKKVQTLVDQQIASAKRPLEQKVQELSEENKTLAQKVGEFEAGARRAKIRGALRDPALVKELGMAPDAMDDSYDFWVDHYFTVDAAGSVVTSDAYQTPGLTPQTALKELRTAGQKRHLFGTTQGAGATAGGGGGAGGPNPFMEDTFSLTAISRMVVDNPQLAARMAVAARKKGYDPVEYLPPALRPQS